MAVVGGSVGMTQRNRPVARKINREGGLELLSWRGLWGGRSTENRHMRHAMVRAMLRGQGGSGGGLCRGARS